MTKKPIILGIESSCDETAVAVIQENKQDTPQILSSIVSSQVDIHKEFGGVVPELAARSHVEKIDLIAKKAIDEHKEDSNEWNDFEKCYFETLLRKWDLDHVVLFTRIGSGLLNSNGAQSIEKNQKNL